MALFGLIFLSPVLIVIGLLIRGEDSGPAFYRGVRVGRYGYPFKIFKFRTMAVDAEDIGEPSTWDDDPRIKRSGKFIRKYKLDELLQLINVFRGI